MHNASNATAILGLDRGAVLAVSERDGEPGLTRELAQQWGPERAYVSTLLHPDSSIPRLPTRLPDSVGALPPENAIVVDEANTAGFTLLDKTAGAPRHDWLTLTGGAIGYGLPAATGAAIAAPDRRVLCLEADGSAMYTISALWAHARETLDITTVIYNNGAYDILRLELLRVGVSGAPGPKAQALLQLKPPALDFVAIATGMGVPARRAITAEEFSECLSAALTEPGPHLIDAVIEPAPSETLAFWLPNQWPPPQAGLGSSRTR